MKQHSVPFEDGEYTFRVSPVSLKDYEEVSDLLEQAHLRFRGGKAIRAFVDRFVEVAAPAVDDRQLTADDLAALDVNLILSLGRQWDVGVRGVPLPLPLPPSDTTVSEANPPQS